MSWAKRRQTLYLTVSGAIVLALIIGLAYVLLSRPASCFNGLKDGTETGVDCGGSCSRICSEDTHAPAILWTRYFEIAPGVVSVAAYIENQNPGAVVKSAPYDFKIYADDNTLIAERHGAALIQAGRITPVVETNIAVGNRTPARAFFEFTAPLLWDKSAGIPRVSVGQQELAPDGTRLSVSVSNDSSTNIAKLTMAAVLFDESGTAVAAAKSEVGALGKGASADVVFTWPRGPIAPAIRAEVTPIVSAN